MNGWGTRDAPDILPEFVLEDPATICPNDMSHYWSSNPPTLLVSVLCRNEWRSWLASANLRAQILSNSVCPAISKASCRPRRQDISSRSRSPCFQGAPALCADSLDADISEGSLRTERCSYCTPYLQISTLLRTSRSFCSEHRSSKCLIVNW